MKEILVLMVTSRAPHGLGWKTCASLGGHTGQARRLGSDWQLFAYLLSIKLFNLGEMKSSNNRIFESSFNTPTWEFFAHSLYLMLSIRKSHFKKRGDLQSINSTIILNCAVTLEGASKTYLLAKIRDQSIVKSNERSKVRFTWTIVDRILKEVETARSFDQLNKYAKDLFSEDWGQCEGYNSIKALIHFRNILAHGSILQYRNVFESNIDNEQGNNDRKMIEEGWNKKELINFLFKQFETFKVLENKPWKVIIRRSLFTNEIADFFIEETKKFLSDMYSRDQTLRVEEAKHIIREIGVNSTPFVSLPNYHLLPKKKAKRGTG